MWSGLGWGGWSQDLLLNPFLQILTSSCLAQPALSAQEWA